jgi:hypothetical protein
VSGALESLGFGPDHSLMKAAVAAVVRGNNLVLAVPPAPAHALPAIGAVVSRGDSVAGPIVVIAPDASISAWVEAIGPVARAAGRRAVAGPAPTRTAHHLDQGTPDVVVTSLWVVMELLRRSALDPTRLAAAILAWPELELSDDAFVPLFADLPKETQRILVTADAGAIAPLIERYAWRAALVGPLGGGAEPPPMARQLRIVSVAWERRVRALGEVADLLDWSRLTVWTADRSAHAEIATILAGHGVDATLVSQVVPPKGPVLFFDPPPPELLTQVAAEQGIVLAPPETELYFRRWIDRPVPLSLTGPVDLANRELTSERDAIRSRIEAGLDRGSLLTLAPLFERHSPTAVAVALHSLWKHTAVAPPRAAERPLPRFSPPVPRTKVWIGVGKKDGVTIGEILSFLSLDLGVPREQLGRVDLKETFTLVECDSDLAAQDLIRKAAGQTLKNRRLSARLDRERPIRK